LFFNEPFTKEELNVYILGVIWIYLNQQ
jgi:hypothetical protein